jgi:hypothetical protein
MLGWTLFYSSLEITLVLEPNEMEIKIWDKKLNKKPNRVIEQKIWLRII